MFNNCDGCVLFLYNGNEYNNRWAGPGGVHLISIHVVSHISTKNKVSK